MQVRASRAVSKAESRAASQGGIGRAVGGGIGEAVAAGVAERCRSEIGRAVGGLSAGGVAGIVAASRTRSPSNTARGNRTRQGAADGTEGPRRGSAHGERADGSAEGHRQGRARDGDARARADARSADVRPLVAALKDASADVREQAAFGLGQLRDARAVEPLAPRSRMQNAERARAGGVRARPAARGLRDRRHHRGAARTPIPSVREQAAFALGQIRDRRAVEPLISALKDCEPERARAGGVRARPDARSRSAIEALVIALKDANAERARAGGLRARPDPRPARDRRPDRSR